MHNQAKKTGFQNSVAFSKKNKRNRGDLTRPEELAIQSEEIFSPANQSYANSSNANSVVFWSFEFSQREPQRIDDKIEREKAELLESVKFTTRNFILKYP